MSRSFFELSRTGERGILVPRAERGIEDIVGDGVSKLPGKMRRKTPPKLPELSQMQVLKHYLRLSRRIWVLISNVDIGQGTCTMKYSPKVNEQFVRSPKVSALHPLQDPSTVQGILEILYKTDLFLREISGMDRFTFQRPLAPRRFWLWLPSRRLIMPPGENQSSVTRSSPPSSPIPPMRRLLRCWVTR